MFLTSLTCTGRKPLKLTCPQRWRLPPSSSHPTCHCPSFTGELGASHSVCWGQIRLDPQISFSSDGKCLQFIVYDVSRSAPFQQSSTPSWSSTIQNKPGIMLLKTFHSEYPFCQPPPPLPTPSIISHSTVFWKNFAIHQSVYTVRTLVKMPSLHCLHMLRHDKVSHPKNGPHFREITRNKIKMIHWQNMILAEIKCGLAPLEI